MGSPAREPGSSGATADAPTAAQADTSAPGATRRSAAAAGTRAGRRERARPGPRPSFLERYRTAIVTIAAVAIVAVGVGYVFIGSTSAAYTCGSQFDPSPTPTVSPGSSTRLGFFQDDMGASHTVNPPQKYLYCPPASGNHYNLPGTLGPIQPRLYKPDDKIGPSNWIHNLEHGGMVVLYRNDSAGATAAGQQAFKDYFTGFPESPICKIPAGALSPVIARFDDMPHPFAALVWDRVFYLDTWDPALVTQFYLTEAERLDSAGQLVAPPEKQCSGPSAAPSASADASASAPAASGSAGPSDAPSTEPSASPEPSAAPS